GGERLPDIAQAHLTELDSTVDRARFARYGRGDPRRSRDELSWARRTRTDSVLGQNDRRLTRVLVHGSPPVHLSRTHDRPGGVVVQFHWRRSPREARSTTATEMRSEKM